MDWTTFAIEVATGSLLGLIAVVAIILAVRKLLRVDITISIGDEHGDQGGKEKENPAQSSD